MSGSDTATPVVGAPPTSTSDEQTGLLSAAVPIGNENTSTTTNAATAAAPTSQHDLIFLAPQVSSTSTTTVFHNRSNAAGTATKSNTVVERCVHGCLRPCRFVLLALWIVIGAVFSIFVMSFTESTTQAFTAPKGTQSHDAEQALAAAFPELASVTDLNAFVQFKFVDSDKNSRNQAQTPPVFECTTTTNLSGENNNNKDENDEDETAVPVRVLPTIVDIPSVRAFLDYLQAGFTLNDEDNDKDKTSMMTASFEPSRVLSVSNYFQLREMNMTSVTTKLVAPLYEDCSIVPFSSARRGDFLFCYNSTTPIAQAAETQNKKQQNKQTTKTNYYLGPQRATTVTMPIRYRATFTGDIAAAAGDHLKSLVRAGNALERFLWNDTLNIGFSMPRVAVLKRSSNSSDSSAMPTVRFVSLGNCTLRQSRRFLTAGANGLPLFIETAVSQVKADMGLTDGVVIPIAFLILGFTVRSLRLLLLPVLALGLSLCIAFGFMYFIANDTNPITGTKIDTTTTTTIDPRTNRTLVHTTTHEQHAPFSFMQMSVSSSAPSLMMSLTIAMNIDYALFFLTRFVEEVKALDAQMGLVSMAATHVASAAGTMAAGVSANSAATFVVTSPVEQQQQEAGGGTGTSAASASTSLSLLYWMLSSAAAGKRKKKKKGETTQDENNNSSNNEIRNTTPERDELAAKSQQLFVDRAMNRIIVNVLATAGKTILVSGTALCLSLIALCLFPMNLLRSFGVGCSLCIVIAMLLSLTLSPVILMIFPRFFMRGAISKYGKYGNSSNNSNDSNDGFFSVTGRLADKFSRCCSCCRGDGDKRDKRAATQSNTNENNNHAQPTTTTSSSSATATAHQTQQEAPSSSSAGLNGETQGKNDDSTATTTTGHNRGADDDNDNDSDDYDETANLASGRIASDTTLVEHAAPSPQAPASPFFDEGVTSDCRRVGNASLGPPQQHQHQHENQSRTKQHQQKKNSNNKNQKQKQNQSTVDDETRRVMAHNIAQQQNKKTDATHSAFSAPFSPMNHNQQNQNNRMMMNPNSSSAQPAVLSQRQMFGRRDNSNMFSPPDDRSKQNNNNNNNRILSDHAASSGTLHYVLSDTNMNHNNNNNNDMVAFDPATVIVEQTTEHHRRDDSIFFKLRHLTKFPFNVIAAGLVLGLCVALGVQAVQLRNTDQFRDYMARGKQATNDWLMFEADFGHGFMMPYHFLFQITPEEEQQEKQMQVQAKPKTKTTVLDPSFLIQAQWVITNMAKNLPAYELAATGNDAGGLTQERLKEFTAFFSFNGDVVPVQDLLACFEFEQQQEDNKNNKTNNHNASTPSCGPVLRTNVMSLYEGLTNKDASATTITFSSSIDPTGNNGLAFYQAMQRLMRERPSTAYVQQQLAEMSAHQHQQHDLRLTAPMTADFENNDVANNSTMITNFTVSVTGVGPQAMDAIHTIYRLFPIIVGCTSACVFVIVGVSFRSIVVPLRCLLSLACTEAFAFGLGVMTYQYRPGLFAVPGSDDSSSSSSNGDDKGFTINFMHIPFGAAVASEGAISWTVPIVAFTIIAGLAVDYDVFLVTRVVEIMKSEHLRTRRALVASLCCTGSIITSAGIVMAVAFCGLMLSAVPLLNQLGFFLVTAVLFDTFICRCILVPATMSMLGRWNWWPSQLSGRRRAASTTGTAGSGASAAAASASSSSKKGNATTTSTRAAAVAVTPDNQQIRPRDDEFSDGVASEAPTATIYSAAMQMQQHQEHHQQQQHHTPNRHTGVRVLDYDADASERRDTDYFAMQPGQQQSQHHHHHHDHHHQEQEQQQMSYGTY